MEVNGKLHDPTALTMRIALCIGGWAVPIVIMLVVAREENPFLS
jgi:hypothetical protein